ncbi:hypothetical protein Bpfe_002445 [Biomphalaria pfeifferi]|uniref:Uncharacterized protein n=1 Tax=Biomphalaria pfeifferi TaxID=112525 RepID=A0AAD8FLA7_BIOPF|nr:hypothetical protein Bpfe_002445 [Biomphalaria pfeifferi]
MLPPRSERHHRPRTTKTLLRKNTSTAHPHARRLPRRGMSSALSLDPHRQSTAHCHTGNPRPTAAQYLAQNARPADLHHSHFRPSQPQTHSM